jgi:hypothetical protein
VYRPCGVMEMIRGKRRTKVGRGGRSTRGVESAGLSKSLPSMIPLL